MKALVVEIRNGIAAVMIPDGRIVGVKQACNVGDTIEIDPAHIIEAEEVPDRKGSRRYLYAAVAVAAALLLTFGGVGVNYYTVQAASYVTVGEDLPVTYTLNRMDRVIDIRAENDDASGLVDDLYDMNVRNMKIGEAMDVMEGLMRERKMLTEEEYAIPVHISAENDRYYDRLEQAVERTGVFRAKEGTMQDGGEPSREKPSGNASPAVVSSKETSESSGAAASAGTSKSASTANATNSAAAGNAASVSASGAGAAGSAGTFPTATPQSTVASSKEPSGQPSGQQATQPPAGAPYSQTPSGAQQMSSGTPGQPSGQTADRPSAGQERTQVPAGHEEAQTPHSGQGGTQAPPSTQGGTQAPAGSEATQTPPSGQGGAQAPAGQEVGERRTTNEQQAQPAQQQQPGESRNLSP